MIHPIKIDALQKIKVWIDEPFEVPLEGPLIKGVHLEAANPIAAKSIIVEWYIPQGARVIYGLLGAEFKPGESGSFSTFFTMPKTTNAYQSTIASPNIVSPETNIPAEIMDKVFEEVSLFYLPKTIHAPEGAMTFKYAAYCPVSSNTWIFRRIVKLLLLILNDGSVGPEELVASRLNKLDL